MAQEASRRAPKRPPRALPRRPPEAKIIEFLLVIGEFGGSPLFGFPTLQDGGLLGVRSRLGGSRTAPQPSERASRQSKRAPKQHNM
eukprot:6615412-Pyramimonas_sp.AAC.1